MRPATFFDRDGTINVDRGYVHAIADFSFTHTAKEALQYHATLDRYAIIVSNQSGVARGYFSMGDVLHVTDHLVQEVANAGGYIDAAFVCPHHPDGTVAQYAIPCACRKPKRGLVDQALRRFPDIDLVHSWVIGDRVSDIQLGIMIGCRTALLRSRYWTEKDLAVQRVHPSVIVDDLFDAIHQIERVPVS